ncbi:RNA polymerase sigma factor [Spirosoma endbachense]|uniref:Sigma-70 family RNA polymerase sigma factor n=1 Tax=Spirosoma endbachense TaxID=2666025 RepID=A0A6P1W7M9_9BACT|nr:sigma-70 family RNA polymerase sigma factor [Spirosoma endbachense]QHW00383.1 sigma-70 family RNA polymerase sigma factor [Spirosoma endbachense]
MNARLSPSEHIALWNSFRQGDPVAFAQLYDLFAADLYRYGYNLIRNKQLVEDCLHELFLHLHENKARLGGTDNIRFYLYRALRRRLVDTATRSGKLNSNEYVFDNAGLWIDSYEQVLIEEQVAEQQKLVVLYHLNQLPRRQKEVLYLVYMNELTYQQTAEVMDVTIKTVYNSVNVALQTLRAYLCEPLPFQKS